MAESSYSKGDVKSEPHSPKHHISSRSSRSVSVKFRYNFMIPYWIIIKFHFKYRILMRVIQQTLKKTGVHRPWAIRNADVRLTPKLSKSEEMLSKKDTIAFKNSFQHVNKTTPPVINWAKLPCCKNPSIMLDILNNKSWNRRKNEQQCWRRWAE